MNSRSLELHFSALSPPEYKAFGGYLSALTNRSSVTPSSLNPESQFHRAALKNCVIELIGSDEADADDLLLAIQPAVARPLSLGQAFAFFRLVNHARISKLDQSGRKRPTDLALVFVPCSPFDPKSENAKVPPPVPARSRKVSIRLPPDAEKSRTESETDSGTRKPRSSRQSLPPRFPVDPFRGSPEKKDRSVSETFGNELQHASNNPFRQRLVSGPTIVARPPPPPLPPRKSHASDALASGRRNKRGSSVSSSSSGLSYHTSGARASPLIQQSLMAAEHQSSLYRKPEPQLQIIRQSSGSFPANKATKPVETAHKNAELIRRVSNAVKESEEEDISAPPRRAASTRSRSKLDSLARPILDADPDVKPWSCVDLMQGQSGQRPYAMIILNQPITRKDIFLRAWSASELRFCADGGANRLYDIFKEGQRSNYIPTLIKGDLDSLRSDVREYYAARDVAIKHDGSEYSTDLQKCIEEVEAAEQQAGYDLLLMGGLSGRVDQTVHVMSLLHKLRKTRPRSFILSSESLAWVLDEGKHLIEIDHSTMGQTCGILPVGIDSAYVKTEGLKWNLDWETSFDGDVSSSNHLLPTEPLVRLMTNKPVMWCVEIKPNLPPLPSLSSVHRHKSLSNRSTTLRGTEELSKGIRDLSAGMAKAAEGLGRELEKLQSTRSTRNSSAGPSRSQRDEVLPDEDRRQTATSTDRLRQESGWMRLD